MTIVKKLVPLWKYPTKCPYSMKPKYITVHNTANDASARSEVAYMTSNNNKTSFHCAIDDKEIVQAIKFTRNAFHAGDGQGQGNRASIGIEICYSKSGGERFDKAEKLAAKYIAKLLKEYGWGISRVKKHQDWSGKYCPHRTLDRGWQRFLDMISKELKSLEEPAKFKAYKIKVNTKSLNVRKEPTTNSKVVTKIKEGQVYTIINEKNGWGQLKSKVGWISLAYTKKA